MIYNKFKSKSMLIIAHRLSTIRNCDTIIVLDQGEIIEQGSHDELLSKQGQYWRLWELQQGNFVRDEESQLLLDSSKSETSDEDEVSYT
jgi:ATP-binding cassette subfamily B protein